jgi:hypothetical protein
LRNKIPYVLLWALLFFFNSKTFSQSLRYSISMPYVSLGAYSTKQLDPFSFTNNQAALAQVKTAGVGVYGERRFLLTENSLLKWETLVSRQIMADSAILPKTKLGLRMPGHWAVKLTLAYNLIIMDIVYPGITIPPR